MICSSVLLLLLRMLHFLRLAAKLTADYFSIARCRVSDDGLLQPYDYTPYFYFLMVFQPFNLKGHTHVLYVQEIPRAPLSKVCTKLGSIEKLKRPIIRILESTLKAAGFVVGVCFIIFINPTLRRSAADRGK